MKYKPRNSPTASLSVPSVSGAQVSPTTGSNLLAWQPSTWPHAPAAVDETFVGTLRRIFQESILDEIANVISDAEKSNGDLQHRGYVVAIAIMCALDTISSYGYGARNSAQIPHFVREHFPPEYHAHADSIVKLYRHIMIHNWNLFRVSMTPGTEPISSDRGMPSVGLKHLFAALQFATSDFLCKLEQNETLRTRTLKRYRKLKNSARP